jgi:hypothetical protein
MAVSSQTAGGQRVGLTECRDNAPGPYPRAETNPHLRNASNGRRHLQLGRGQFRRMAAWARLASNALPSLALKQ